jgi:RimJ/RimL family protein N-acetyltransferase
MKDGLDVQFSQETPPIAELKRFFEGVGWQSSEAFIKEAIPFKPHSLLTTVWVRLNQNGNPVGMARLYLPPKSPVNAPAFIGDVIIGTQHQGKGYGIQLVNAIEAHCQEKGVQLLVIEPNANSEGFWRTIGFTPRESMQGLLFKDVAAKREAMQQKT